MYSSPSGRGRPRGLLLADNGTDASLHDSVEDCSACPAGTYAETTRATSAAICTACPSGRFLSDPGTDPSLHDSLDDCFTCPPGAILASATNGLCVVCPVGAYTPRSGLTACATCPAGLYNDDPGTSASLHVNCTACPAGSFLADAGTNASLHDSLKDCALCRAGSYSEHAGSNCTTCPAGFYKWRGPSNLCEPPRELHGCPAGPLPRRRRHQRQPPRLLSLKDCALCRAGSCLSTQEAQATCPAGFYNEGPPTL